LSSLRLLVDPWLQGAEVDVAPWFNSQWHRTPPLAYADLPAFDAVLITQKYPDHCHRDTLRHLQPPVVLAPASLGPALGRLLPAAELHLFDARRRQHALGAVRVRQLPSRRRVDPIYHAYLIEDDAQTLMLANHGFDVEAADLEVINRRGIDLLLSPFNLYRLPRMLGGCVAPGLAGLRQLIQQVTPSRVAQTHDELKHARGLVPALAHIEVFDASQCQSLSWLQDRFLAIDDYQRVVL
jgi:hypothetical protein